MENQIVKSLIVAFKKSAWAPITFFLIHTISTQIFRGYLRFPNLDTLEHFIGGVAIAYFFYKLLASVRASLFQSKYANAMHNLVTFLAVGTTTAFWEFTEYILDRTVVIHGIRQGSIGDTMFDMALGMVGAIVYLIVVWYMSRRVRIKS